jgi:outer membrane protein insertion porin family
MLCCCSLLHGQTEDTAPKQAPGTSQATQRILSAYEGQKVSSLEIAGRPDLKSEQFASLFVQEAGQPFSREKVDQTVAALQAAGKFERVRIQVQPDPNGLRILFVLEPAMYIGIFQFPGAGRFNYSRLLQVANYPVQTPYNARDVEQDRENLVTFFRQQGYFQAEVNPEVQVDAQHAIANILFRAKLGTKAKFGLLDIDGMSPEATAHYRAKLTNWMARVRGSAVRSGKKYQIATINRASQYLQTLLQKDGYLGAQVTLKGAEYHADTNLADIHLTANPGAKTDVQIEGARIWSWTRKSVLPVYQGAGINSESVQEGEQALTSYFQAKGFFDVKVSSKFDQSPNGDAIVYEIEKGQKHKVTDIDVAGNTNVPDSELTPQIYVKKKQLFSVGKFNDQLVRKSVKNLEAVYQSEGFSDVKITPKVTRQDGNIQVAFHVEEGPRDIVNSIKIVGAKLPQSQFAPKGLMLAAGQPYSQAHVRADRTNIIAHYLQAGYLNASFRETATAVAKNDPHHINVIYRIFEGPRVVAGNILTLGDERTQQRLINESVKSVRSGEPLTETGLLTAGSRLYDQTGVFDWAEVDPKRDITTQTNEDVLVKVHEAKRNDFTYGIGFEIINRGGSVPSGTVAIPGLPPVGLPPNFVTSEKTFYGPRGSVQYNRNNIHGRGETLSFTAFAGRLDQRGAMYYIDPSLRWTAWKATASLSAEHNQENPVYSSQEELASLQVQRPLDRLNHKVAFFRYSFSKTDLTHILIPDLVPPEDQHVRLSTIAANITRDTRDNALDEHKGVLQSLEVDFNSSKLGSSVDFAKMTGQAAYYKQAFHNIVWANSLRIGLALPFNNSFVPLSEAFFTGGSNSLRGYPLDGAGPQRQVQITGNGCDPANPCTIQVPSGGNELLLINSEARIPMRFKKGLGIVLFYDGGNVFPQIGFHDFTELYSNNVGIGLRYSTPVGPIRIDFGHNLNPIEGIKPNQYFITIGQAF